MRGRLLPIFLLLSGLALAEPRPTDCQLLEASIVGEIRSQGLFHLKPGATLLDLWRLGGGETNHADLEAVVLVRAEKTLELNLRASGLESLSQTQLLSGDVLMVSPAKRLSVTGEVRSPGVYGVSYKSKRPVEEALEAAGGTEETAALHRVLLVRPSLKKPIVMDLTRPVAEKPQDGDIISVQPQRCAVLGGVEKQGQQVLVGNDTLFDVVSAAGCSRGQLKHVTVIRAVDVEAGNDRKEIYDLEGAFRTATASPRVPIYDGDVIYVPTDDRPDLEIFSPRYNYYDRVLFPIYR